MTELLTRLRAGDDLHVEAAITIERLRDRLIIVEAELATTLGEMATGAARSQSPPPFSLAYEVLPSHQKE